MYNFPYTGGYQQQNVIRVNGENGARSLQLPPNSSALVLDETAPLVWLCQSDGAGYRTVIPYKIEPYKPVTQESLEERLNRLEARCESYFRADATNAKSCSADVGGVPQRTESTAVFDQRGATEPDAGSAGRTW